MHQFGEEGRRTVRASTRIGACRRGASSRRRATALALDLLRLGGEEIRVAKVYRQQQAEKAMKKKKDNWTSRIEGWRADPRRPGYAGA